jgi:hypothetical protein
LSSSSSAELLACCAAAPSLWQQQQQQPDCFECAAIEPTAGIATSEAAAAAAAAAKSHLAWCCDDAECLPSGTGSTAAAAQASPPGLGLAYDSNALATTSASSTPIEDDWMRWSAAALATATATATAATGPRTHAPPPPPNSCLDPNCIPVVAMPPPPTLESSTLADCPSCATGPSTSSLTGTPITTTEDHHQHGLDQDGLPHTDLDELLNGLDEETIQDIVRLPPLFQVPA